MKDHVTFLVASVSTMGHVSIGASQCAMDQTRTTIIQDTKCADSSFYYFNEIFSQ